MDEMVSSTLSEQNIPRRSKLKIGYFELRGRAQVPRILLEYLKIPYENQMFKTKAEFALFKQQQLQNWPLLDLPYLIDGDVKITQTVPICFYIINKYGSPTMLGSSLQQMTILDMYCWSIDSVGIGLAELLWAKSTNKQLNEMKERFWLETVQDKMLALQAFIGGKKWMMGSLSLFDFSIYELIHYVAEVFPLHIKSFPRLRALEQRFRQLPEIASYENSPRAIKAILPNQVKARVKIQ